MGIMDFNSEIAIVLNELSYKKLLVAINAITNSQLRHNVDALLSRATIYRNKKDNTILIYCYHVPWENKSNLNMDEAVFIEHFLKNLSDKEYRYLRIEGYYKTYYCGSLWSDFDPLPLTIIDKNTSDCEIICYQEVAGTLPDIAQPA